MLCLVTQKDSAKIVQKRLIAKITEKKMIYGSYKKEIYLVVNIIFCNFAAEMVALPSKSGGVKEHQKGMRCDSSTVPAAVIPVL